MFMKFTKNEVIIIFGLSLLKFGVGFISSMVIPIFPSLIRIHFNNSSPMVGANSFSGSNSSSDYNYQQLSLLFVTKNLCQIVSSPVVGILADIFGFLVVLLSGTIFHVFTMLVYGLGDLYYLLLLGRIFEAISASIINCASAAFVPHRFKDDKQRGFVYGIKALSTCVGNALGPAYGGVVYEYYGKVVVFLSFLAVVFVEIILVLFIMYIEKVFVRKIPKSVYLEVELELNGIESHSKEKETRSPSEENPDGDEVKVALNTDSKSISKKNKRKRIENGFLQNVMFFKDPYFLLSIGTFPVIFISTYLLFSSLPRHMLLKYNSSESHQGVIWLVTLLGYLLGFLVGNIINTRFSKSRHTILVGYTLVHAVSVVCIPFMPIWWSVALPLCVIVHIILVVEVVMSPILATIVEVRHHSRFGVMSGIIMMAMAITGSLGSFFGPILLSTIGFTYTNVGVCVINILYAPFYLFLRRFCRIRK